MILSTAKVVILGSKGMLGQEFVNLYGSLAVGLDREECDISKVDSLRLKLNELMPSVVINCAAYNDVDAAETNHEAAFLLNSEVPGNLAKICKELNIALVHFSTNYVFNGEKGNYSEADKPSPLSTYGKSKLEGESNIQKVAEKFYIIRTAVLFGKRGEGSQTKKSFAQLMLDLSEKQNEIKAVNDEVNNPTYAFDLAAEVKLLLEQQKPFGIYHITNSGAASWFDYAKEVFRIAGKKVNLIPVSRTEFPRVALTPKIGTLANTKLSILRPWQEALSEFLESRR